MADGKDTNQCYTSTPLLKAISHENLDIAEILISNGAVVNRKERFKSTPPLLKAVVMGNMGIVKLLLDHGARVCDSDSRGKSAIMAAIEQDGKCVMVKFLMDHLEKEFKEDKDGWQANLTAFFPHVISSECLKCTDMFLQYGVDLSRKDKHGCEVLLYAFYKNLINRKCSCNKHGVDSLTSGLCLLPVCTNRDFALQPVNHSIIDRLISKDASVKQLWDMILWGLTLSGINSCKTDALIYCIRCQGFQFGKDIRTTALFINAAKSSKPEVMVHLYAAGFNPTIEECELCENICNKKVSNQVSNTQTSVKAAQWLRYITKHPRSLQSCATVAVRKALGDNVLARTVRLSAPQTLQDIITLKELTELDVFNDVLS